MGSYYTIQVRLDFKDSLSDAENDTLLYLLGMVQTPSERCLKETHLHGYKVLLCEEEENPAVIAKLRGTAEAEHGGFYRCQTWSRGRHLSGMNLYMSSVRDPVHWELLERISWFVSLSTSSGVIGYMHSEYFDDCVQILYAKEGALFFGKFLPTELTGFHAPETLHIDTSWMNPGAA